jgi:hypothetical protein
LGLKTLIRPSAGCGIPIALTPAGDMTMSPTPSLINRVRSEFIEMPGLRLRLEQAQRLWNLDRPSCEIVLRSLVEAEFLRQYGDRYSRA